MLGLASVAALQLLLQKADYPIRYAVFDLSLAQSAARAYIQGKVQLAAFELYLPNVGYLVLDGSLGLDLYLEPAHIQATHTDAKLLSQ